MEPHAPFVQASVRRSATVALSEALFVGLLFGGLGSPYVKGGELLPGLLAFIPVGEPPKGLIIQRLNYKAL